MFNLRSALFVLSICVFGNTIAKNKPVNHLDLFIAREELKRFFEEFYNGDFYIIKKGVIDNFVQNQATGYLRAIDPSIQSLELIFQSKFKMYYRLHLSSSDRKIMKSPTSSIKMSGTVPKKPRAFKIRFPCTRRHSGTAMLTVKMEFVLPGKKRSRPIRQFVLKLRRSCEKAKEIAVAKVSAPAAKTNYICSKKCDRNNVLRRFCLSDFAIRARVESSSLSKSGRPLYKLRVTKLYKRTRVAVGKRVDVEIYSRETTCKCDSLQVRRIYLILGKENARTNTLFLDDYTYAIEWPEGGKKMAKLHKRRASCPRRFGTKWYY